MNTAIFPTTGGVECGISIKIDSEWVTKWDAAENTQVEAVKGGRSGAMKRAAVQWGIGRYLYNLEEGFAQTSLDKKQGWHRAKLKDGTGFYWLPPSLRDGQYQHQITNHHQKILTRNLHRLTANKS